MKFSVAVAIASTLAFANAAAVRTVTQIHWVTQGAQQPQQTDGARVTVTVYANGNAATTQQPEQQDNNNAATTLVTKQADQEAQPTEGVQKQAAPQTTTSSSSAAPQPSSTGSSDSKGPNDFAQSMLDIHNSLRSKHSAPALQWDDTIAQYAQNYANGYDCSMNLKHSGGKYGENLAVGYKSGPDAVQAWYDEVKDYTYGSNTFDHFTQVVWKGASKLGCAVKNCQAQGNSYYVICNYDTGNVVGQQLANVLPN